VFQELFFLCFYADFLCFKGGKAILLHEDSAAGTTGDENLYQNFFICLSYESRKVGNATRKGLFIQYGIYVDSEETGHLYLSYFDTSPLDPAFYSFGSRNSNVQILNAHIVQLSEDEQVKLRCAPTSDYSKATELSCDYKCHPACDGCRRPNLVSECKKCLYGAIRKKDTVGDDLECVLQCPNGFNPVGLSKVCEGS
jgi:hypothetical protein